MLKGISGGRLGEANRQLVCKKLGVFRLGWSILGCFGDMSQQGQQQVQKKQAEKSVKDKRHMRSQGRETWVLRVIISLRLKAKHEHVVFVHDVCGSLWLYGRAGAAEGSL